jgi:hypothetical protein
MTTTLVATAAVWNGPRTLEAPFLTFFLVVRVLSSVSATMDPRLLARVNGAWQLFVLPVLHFRQLGVTQNSRVQYGSTACSSTVFAWQPMRDRRSGKEEGSSKEMSQGGSCRSFTEPPTKPFSAISVRSSSFTIINASTTRISPSRYTKHCATGPAWRDMRFSR